MESELTSGKLRAVIKIDQLLIVVGILIVFGIPLLTGSSLLLVARKLVH
jgi:hypothetical protein